MSFRGGLRIDAEARQAYAEAIGPNADHFLCVEDGREQYNTSFTSRRPRNEYVTFHERGISGSTCGRSSTAGRTRQRTTSSGFWTPTRPAGSRELGGSSHFACESCIWQGRIR